MNSKTGPVLFVAWGVVALAAAICFAAPSSSQTSSRAYSGADYHVFVRDCLSGQEIDDVGSESRSDSGVTSVPDLQCDSVEYQRISGPKGVGQVALLLKDPQTAARMEGVVKDPDGNVVRCGGQAASLELVADKDRAKTVAVYNVSGCSKDRELMWIAKSLADQRKEVAAGGLLATVRGRANPQVLLDEITVRVAAEVTLPISDEDTKLLEAVDLQLVSNDPFDPTRKFLLRTMQGGFETARDPLVRIDLLSCMVDDDLDAIWCAERFEQFARETFEQNRALSAQWTPLLDSDNRESKNIDDRFRDVRETARMFEQLRTQLVTGTPEPGDESKALERFRLLGPVSVEPTLVSIATGGAPKGFDAWLTAQKKKEETFAFQVDLSAVSNKTDLRETSQLLAAIKGSRGLYPGELNFEFGGQVEFDDEEVEDEVTKLAVSFDRYLSRWFEWYVFTGLSSNSFMSIDQRWEAGTGFLFEWEKAVSTRDTFCDDLTRTSRRRSGAERPQRELLVPTGIRRNIDYLQDQMRQEIFRGTSSPPAVSPVSRALYCGDPDKGTGPLKEGVEKQYAKWQLGVAVTGLIEFEEPAELTIRAATGEDDKKPVTFKSAPPSRQTFRVAVRPTFTYRPHEKVTIDAHTYFKIDPDPEDDDLYSGSDIRRESRLRIDVEISDSPKVGFFADVQWFHDSRPPRLSALDVFTLARSEITFSSVDEPMDPRLLTLTGDLTGNEEIDAKTGAMLTGFSAQEDYRRLNFGVSLKF